MPKPNYQFEKRQRDLAKKQKQEEKRLKKLADKATEERGLEVEAIPSDAECADDAHQTGESAPET